MLFRFAKRFFKKSAQSCETVENSPSQGGAIRRMPSADRHGAATAGGRKSTDGVHDATADDKKFRHRCADARNHPGFLAHSPAAIARAAHRAGGRTGFLRTAGISSGAWILDGSTWADRAFARSRLCAAQAPQAFGLVGAPKTAIRLKREAFHEKRPTWNQVERFGDLFENQPPVPVCGVGSVSVGVGSAFSPAAGVLSIVS